MDVGLIVVKCFEEIVMCSFLGDGVMCLFFIDEYSWVNYFVVGWMK